MFNKRCTFLSLVARPPMVSTARRHVVSQVTAWDERLGADVREALEVAVSELVTNAILHTDAPLVDIHVAISERVLRLEVHDGSRHLPMREPPCGDAEEHGRGLMIVTAVCDRSGFELTLRGKTAWAEFDLPPVDQRTARAGTVVCPRFTSRLAPAASASLER